MGVLTIFVYYFFILIDKCFNKIGMLKHFLDMKNNDSLINK